MSVWSSIAPTRPVPRVTPRWIRWDSGSKTLTFSAAGATTWTVPRSTPAAKLPGGDTFEGPDALKELLLERKDTFIRNLTSKLLGFALGRGLSHEDDCVVDAITEKLAADDYKAQTLITEIVTSVPFRYKQGQNTTAVVETPASQTPQKDPTDGTP